MVDRRKFGLQLLCIELKTHRIEQFTPRNRAVAFAMVEGHALEHGRGWEYRLEDWTHGRRTEPIRLANIDESDPKPPTADITRRYTFRPRR